MWRLLLIGASLFVSGCSFDRLFGIYEVGRISLPVCRDESRVLKVEADGNYGIYMKINRYPKVDADELSICNGSANVSACRLSKRFGELSWKVVSENTGRVWEGGWSTNLSSAHKIFHLGVIDRVSKGDYLKFTFFRSNKGPELDVPVESRLYVKHAPGSD